MPTDREPFVGLALSGGGARAMAFHLGCLRALHDRGILAVDPPDSRRAVFRRREDARAVAAEIHGSEITMLERNWWPGAVSGPQLHQVWRDGHDVSSVSAEGCVSNAAITIDNDLRLTPAVRTP